MLQFASLLLPEEDRHGVLALYAWCRRADEICDSPTPSRSPSEREALLGEVEADFRRFRKGGQPANAIDAELARALARWPSIGDEPFLDMLAGMRTELRTPRFPAFEPDLRHYAYCVAGTVGLMVLPILGVARPTKEMKKGAIDLGIAIQLTNILRDVGEDAQRGRIYLPEEDLAHFGVDEADILAGRMTPAYRKLVVFQVERARGYFDSARSVVPELPSRSQLVVLAVIHLLAALLGEVLARDCDNLSCKVRIGLPKRAACVAAAVRDWVVLMFRGPN